MLNYFIIVLSLLIFTCALLTILSKNPIHSILFLILVFIISTIFLIILNVEFIAMLFLVVYIGAITVLFLFVVMMLNVKIVEIDERIIRYIPIGSFIGLIFILEVGFLLSKNFLPASINILDIYLNKTLETFVQQQNVYIQDFAEINNNINIEQVANALFLKYPYFFMLSGIILFIAMFGAIVLTLNPQFKIKKQNYYKQNATGIITSIRFIK